jgi:CBS domain-containing protein
MLVSDVMTHVAETIGPDETLQAAAVKMRECGVGALVVCVEGRPVGMLTDRDIVVRSVAEGRAPEEADVRSAMTPQVIECAEDDELEAAVMRMERGAVRRVVVLDAERQLAGMLTVDDVALRSPTLAGEVIEHVRAPDRPILRGPWPWWEAPAT